MNRTEVLIREADRVGQVISSLVSQQDRIQALGITLATGGLTIGLHAGDQAVLLVLPITLLMVVLLGVRIGTEILALGGYKRHLEERVNLELHERVLAWESVLAPQVIHRSAAIRILRVSGPAVVLAICVLSFGFAWPHYHHQPALYWVSLVVTLAGFVGWALAAHGMVKTFCKSYDLASQWQAGDPVS